MLKREQEGDDKESVPIIMDMTRAHAVSESIVGLSFKGPKMTSQNEEINAP